MLVRYILSSVWVRLSIFSPLSIIQYVGLYVFSLPISLVMIERIYILCLIIIKSEVWTINHCVGLGHETMMSAVCLSIFLLNEISGKNVNTDRSINGILLTHISSWWHSVFHIATSYHIIWRYIFISRYNCSSNCIYDRHLSDCHRYCNDTNLAYKNHNDITSSMLLFFSDNNAYIAITNETARTVV